VGELMPSNLEGISFSVLRNNLFDLRTICEKIMKKRVLVMPKRGLKIGKDVTSKKLSAFLKSERERED